MRSRPCFQPWEGWLGGNSVPRDSCMLNNNRRCAIEKLALLLAAAACLLFSQAARAQSQWKIDVVDSGSGRNVGKFTSLSVDGDDNLHVGYYDETRQALRYGFRSAGGGRWYTMEVDASGGYESLAVDKEGHPHFVYAGPNESGLRYATWDGKKWDKQTLDNERIDFFNFIRIGPDDKPRISYYQRLHRDGSFALHLKYAYWDGKAWYTETVDPQSATGKFNSLALDSKGKPHIAYSDVDLGDLRYTTWTGSEWRFSIPESHQQAEGWVGIGSSIEVERAGIPHIAYVDVGHHYIKYATWHPEAGWKSQVVDTISGKADNIDRVLSNWIAGNARTSRTGTAAPAFSATQHYLQKAGMPRRWMPGTAWVCIPPWRLTATMKSTSAITIWPMERSGWPTNTRKLISLRLPKAHKPKKSPPALRNLNRRTHCLFKSNNGIWM